MNNRSTVQMSSPQTVCVCLMHGYIFLMYIYLLNKDVCLKKKNIVIWFLWDVGRTLSCSVQTWQPLEVEAVNISFYGINLTKIVLIITKMYWNNQASAERSWTLEKHLLMKLFKDTSDSLSVAVSIQSNTKIRQMKTFAVPRTRWKATFHKVHFR